MLAIKKDLIHQVLIIKDSNFIDIEPEYETWFVLIYLFEFQKIKMPRIRVGAICNDGTYSTATGRGACSYHGGVREWIYEDSEPTQPPQLIQPIQRNNNNE